MNGLLGTNVFLGLQDVLARRKLYATMLVVLVLAAFIIIMPRNLHHTIASESFATYMGVGHSDLRFDVQQADDTAGRAAEIAAAKALMTWSSSRFPPHVLSLPLVRVKHTAPHGSVGPR